MDSTPEITWSQALSTLRDLLNLDYWWAMKWRDISLSSEALNIPEYDLLRGGPGAVHAALKLQAWARGDNLPGEPRPIRPENPIVFERPRWPGRPTVTWMRGVVAIQSSLDNRSLPPISDAQVLHAIDFRIHLRQLRERRRPRLLDAERMALSLLRLMADPMGPQDQCAQRALEFYYEEAKWLPNRGVCFEFAVEQPFSSPVVARREESSKTDSSHETMTSERAFRILSCQRSE